MVSPRRAPAGQTVCYRFTAQSNGHPVRNVKIRFAGHALHTSAGGKAEICTMLRSGTYRARAAKSGYLPASARVLAGSTGTTSPTFTQ